MSIAAVTGWIHLLYFARGFRLIGMFRALAAMFMTRVVVVVWCRRAHVSGVIGARWTMLKCG